MTGTRFSAKSVYKGEKFPSKKISEQYALESMWFHDYGTQNRGNTIYNVLPVSETDGVPFLIYAVFMEKYKATWRLQCLNYL